MQGKCYFFFRKTSDTKKLGYSEVDHKVLITERNIYWNETTAMRIENYFNTFQFFFSKSEELQRKFQLVCVNCTQTPAARCASVLLCRKSSPSRLA